MHISDLKVNSYITVKTNISDITVPLLSYNGKLQVVLQQIKIVSSLINPHFQYLPFKSKDYSLDLGLISFDSTKEIFFLVVNNNPVSITIRNVKTSIPMTNAVMLGCGKGDHNAALLQVTFQNLTQCVSIEHVFVGAN